MIDFETTKEKILKNPDVVKEYENQSTEFLVARSIIAARLRSKMTQKDVAKKMHTSQSQVARLESGEHMPSFNSIKKYAKAIQQNIHIEISAD